jgi:hypothetical protein
LGKNATSDVMMRNKTLKYIAIYMILLVITIPIMSASALSSSISVTDYYGDAQVEGYLAEEDSLIVGVEVEWDETETISELNETTNITTETTTDVEFLEEYAKLFIDHNEYSFDSCTGSGPYTCVYEDAEQARQGSILELEAKLYDDDENILSEDDKSMYVDVEEPEIEEFELDEVLIDDFNVTYEVSDEACSSCLDECSGISTVDLVIDGAVIATDLYTAETNGTDESTPICDTEGTFELSLDGIDQGEYEVCLRVTDRVGNQEEACEDTLVDYSGPEFSTSSFVLLDDDYEVDYYNGPMDVVMSINITEVDSTLDTTSVYANLSSLNEVIPGDYEEKTPDYCTAISDDEHYCLWSFTIDLSETNTTTSHFIKFYAEDTVGNNETYTKSIELAYDATSPVVQSIASIWGEYISLNNNTLMMEIQEADSGFDKNQVEINLAELGLGTKEADYCEASGTIWNCYWESFSISTSTGEGVTVYAYPHKATDDIGNEYNEEESITSQVFTVDKFAPEFENITIIPIGTGLEVLTVNDLAQITAIITDDTSGIDEETVLADFSAFDAAETWTYAQSCEDYGDGTYECVWDYTGQLTDGEVELEIVAIDFAGNVKYSGDDNEYGDIEVVEYEEKEVDYWHELADAGTLPYINPNFLRQSQQGTIVTLDFTIEPRSLNPYLHLMEITSCSGIPYVPYVQSVEQELTIISQLHYPDLGLDRKYMLLNVPAFLAALPYNETIDTEGSYIDISCQGYVVQSRTMNGDIYTPNEEFNVTATLPLKSGLFTQPDIQTIDKMQRYEGFVDFLDKYILSWMGFITEWGPKICGPLSSIRSLVNNIASALLSIRYAAFAFGGATILEGAVGEQGVISQLSKGIDKFWKGRGGKGNRHCETGVGACLNPNAMLSIGYICDLVLCQSCSKIWSQDILGGIAGAAFGDGRKEPLLERLINIPYQYAAVKLPGAAGAAISTKTRTDAGATVPPPEDPKSQVEFEFDEAETYDTAVEAYAGEFQYGIASDRLTITFDPRQNLVFALICSPPCITGIYSRLKVYREIVVAYNACLNVAAIKQEDISQCDEFLQAQICQQLVGAFFWHWIYKLMKDFVSKTIIVSTFNFLENLAACPQVDAGGKLQEMTIGCSAYRGAQAVVNFVWVVVDTVQIFQGFAQQFESMGSNKDAQESQEDVEEELTEAYENQQTPEETLEQSLQDQAGGTDIYG